MAKFLPGSNECENKTTNTSNKGSRNENKKLKKKKKRKSYSFNTNAPSVQGGHNPSPTPFSDHHLFLCSHKRWTFPSGVVSPQVWLLKEGGAEAQWEWKDSDPWEVGVESGDLITVSLHQQIPISV